MALYGDARIIDDIMWREGGETYTDDPADSGGPTRFGVTIPTLERFRKQPVTAEDIKNLTRQEAEEIYALLYLRPFDGLPAGLRENVIDMGVNAGVSRATKLLQQLIGAPVDGIIGPQTRTMALQAPWNDGYAYMRVAFYEALIERAPKNVRFRRGWRSRALSFLTSPLSRPALMAMSIPPEPCAKASDA